MTEKARKRTTPARSREKTVAQAKGGQGKGQGTPPVDTPRLPSPVPDPDPMVAPPVATSDSPMTAALTSTDFCDNHADALAVLVTKFPWAETQKFCRSCVPTQYAYLL